MTLAADFHITSINADDTENDDDLLSGTPVVATTIERAQFRYPASLFPRFPAVVGDGVLTDAVHVMGQGWDDVTNAAFVRVLVSLGTRPFAGEMRGV